MAVPKQRHNQSRRDRRRKNIYIDSPVLITCPKCGKPVLPHTICGYCGFYKNKEYINVLAKLEKKEQKKRAKEMKAHEKTEHSHDHEHEHSGKETEKH
ncbi:MAG: 50S ribosomal protein L32 [Candidatus Pacebacteria bacterium]|nr:50S ribosomal protein L32 [Candidatus Paceibacterota bacterium]